MSYQSWTVYLCEAARSERASETETFDILAPSWLITVPVSVGKLACHSFHYQNGLDHAVALTFAKQSPRKGWSIDKLCKAGFMADRLARTRGRAQ